MGITSEPALAVASGLLHFGQHWALAHVFEEAILMILGTSSTHRPRSVRRAAAAYASACVGRAYALGRSSPCSHNREDGRHTSRPSCVPCTCAGPPRRYDPRPSAPSEGITDQHTGLKQWP